MSEDHKKLVAKRASIKSKLTRFKSYLDKTEQSKEFSQLEDRFNIFKDCLSEFESVQSELELTDSDSDHNVEREYFEDVYFELMARSKALLSKYKSNGSSLSQQSINIDSTHTSATQIKLPTIKLPTFNGKYEDWLHFQELFKTLIDENSTLSAIQKFHYLKSSLQGQALSVIDSLEVSSTNYDTAWDLLKHRFENKRVIVNNHVTSIFEIKKLEKESGKALRFVIDSLNKHIRALKTLGQPTDYWDTLLVYIVTKKLDYNTAKLWENHQLTTEVPKFEELIGFLENRCIILESFENTRSRNHSESLQSTTKPHYHSKKLSTSLVSCITNCPVCNNNHKVFQCDLFHKMSVSQRLQTVRDRGLCINCLSKTHLIKDCKSSACKTCEKKHNTLLHFNSDDGKPQKKEIPHTSNTKSSPAILASNSNIHHTLLSTAVVDIEDVLGNKHECRVLLDSASQSNLITESMVRNLNIAKTKTHTKVSGVGEKQASITHEVVCTIYSKHNSYKATISCLVLPKITQNLPQIPIDTTTWKLPDSLKLADLHFNQPGPVDMLIGAELFLSLLNIGQMRPKKGAPIFQKTSLGWIASGKFANQHENPEKLCHLSIDSTLHTQMQRFWEIETCERTDSNLSGEEILCETLYRTTTVRDITGRYTVDLPVKENFDCLGDSKKHAELRFLQLERKLSKNPNVHREYSEFMDEYERLGHMEIIDQSVDNTSKQTYYIPHLPVIREDSSTTKLRVVFDASAKSTSGLSLNDTLMVGPTVQQELFSILTRFRSHQYVLTADIEKMYRQIRINEQQADLQRILWRTNSKEPIKVFKLSTVTYGTASAPFLAIRTLQQLASDEQETYPIGSAIVMKDFYVDDLMTGANTLEEAQEIQSQVTKLLKSGGFNIRKWNSNSSYILRDIDVSLRAQSDDKMEKSPTKVLGMLWNSGLDYFQYSVKEQGLYTKITKRSVLSEIASIFDPLGLLGPIIVKLKMFMQELWKSNVNWDESLPSELHSTWQVFRHQLAYLRDVKISRCAFTRHTMRSELHGFCDASEKAYGACIYVRTINANGKISVHMLCSKSRVSPLKKTTIPRLELCGALLLSELVNKVAKSDLHFDSYTLWSDSTIVLAWINAPSSNWKTFVANRVSMIQELTHKCSWLHVRTSDNPADLISRGLTPVQIVDCRLWWRGPEWLSMNADQWPKLDLGKLIDVPEQKSNPVNLVVTKKQPFIDIERFSSLGKLQRVTAYCLRFISNMKNPTQKDIGSPSPQELHSAIRHLIQAEQELLLPQEYQNLKLGKQVHHGSALSYLQPFIDDENIIRVGGRLKHADIELDQKHPIVLPYKSHLTQLIIRNEHIRLLHAPPQLLLSSLRQKYWPLRGRDLVRKVVHCCVKCFKTNPKHIQPQMADLPASRLQVTRPFTNTGTDISGPVYIRSHRRKNSPLVKSYIVLFVCMSTKAIHLELASDLSTEAFLAALKRFISRRGICSNIFSDNGTNYVGANRELKELRELFQSQEHQNKILNETSSYQINWHFIPPRSPHFGGLWEAGVKSMKYHLKRVLGNASLTYEETYTVLTLIEACLNSRPLTPISNDPNDSSPLTPGHFLTGNVLTALPEPCLINTPINRLSLWQRTQQLAQHFWTRWSKEYLSFLQQRPKWRSEGVNLKPGQLVIVREDNLPPMKWVSARVLEVHPGADGRARVATIKTANGTYKRAANRLCVLPLESESATPTMPSADDQPQSEVSGV